jgi:hypothetical protein
MKFGLVSAVLAMIGAAAACGGSASSDSKGGGNGSNPPPAGSGDNNPPPPANDAGTSPDASPPVDHGAPSSTYPAFKPDLANLANNGGVVLTNAVIVPVTWPGDPGAAFLEKFSDEIGTSDYWTKTTVEYGVGPGQSGAANHVRLTEAAPAVMSDQDLDNFVIKNAGDPAISHWPAPTAQTVYLLMLPQDMSLTLGGQDACGQGIGGYHTNTTVNGNQVAYAIVPRCAFGGATTPQQLLDLATQSASHELIEAATDPHPQTDAAWIGYDDNHLSFDFFQQFQSENADSCEFFKSSFYQNTETSFAFNVQRSWSNKSAQAGHDPCVPLPANPYFNVAPIAAEDLVVDLSTVGGNAASKTRGYAVKVGETRTFAVGLYSDAPTSGPWALTVAESNPVFGAPKTSRLAVSIDKQTGQNGEKAYVTVTVKLAGKTKAELLTVVSSSGQSKHYMPILIGTP